jgi:pyruvate/2-oxoglutarate dehydrogenase complex dihydrolipoamide acyltransferase (E2) component
MLPRRAASKGDGVRPDDRRPDLLGRYRELSFPIARTATVDTVRIGRTRHHIPVLLEVDVTQARLALADRRAGGREDSFTAWAVACIARAVSEHKRVHALRRGRGRLVIFDDVDVSLAVYRRTDGVGERVPMPFVVRRANEKSAAQIGEEIRQAQTRTLAAGEQWLASDGRVPPPRLMRLAFSAPFHLRKWLFWDRLLADPFRVKRTMGTVMVTSVPLTTRSGTRAWAVPVGIHPLSVALGAVARLHDPERELLSMTVLFDHDVTDGVPVALFLRRLTELMETGYGLGGEYDAAAARR